MSALENPIEARPLARVAGTTALLHDSDQERVTVAVVADLAHELTIARGLPFAPQLLPTAAPEPRPSGLESPQQRLLGHPGHHENEVRFVFLDNGGHEA